MKKSLPIIGIFVGVLVLFGLLFFFVKGKKTERSVGNLITPTPEVVEIKERPYITLTPRTDGHELKLEVSNLNGIRTVEYELVYLAGDVSRGVIGSVDLKGKDSFSRDLLLGSCSKNVCKYDEGVREGTLSLRLQGEKTQKYEVPFNLFTGSQAKGRLASQDENFTFLGNLQSQAFYLVQTTVGIPKTFQGKIMSLPYGIFTSSSTQEGGEIRLKLQESLDQAKVFGWDGSSWIEYSKNLETDGQTVSVQVDSLTVFIAVSP